MSAEQTTSLMQRKARTGREAQAARAMSWGRALRLTAAKQAEQQMALAVNTLGVTRRNLGLEDISGCLDADALTLLMDGPNGQVAAVLLDTALVTGLIQQQTMGTVRPVREGGEARGHTSTDAALCAPFIEALLSRTALLPEEEDECALFKGYRFGVIAQEPRHAQLALDAPVYELIEMTLDLAAGTRAGKLVLILPRAVRVPEAVEDAEGEGAETPKPAQNLAQNIMSLKADLTIALTRKKMPLKMVSDLKVGDVLDLDLTGMDQALVLDSTGKVISKGTLGQIDGFRALQVEQQKAGQHTQPRRRATDREELELPDVRSPQTLGTGDPAPIAMDTDGGDAVPSMSDVDIFGNLDELPDMPEIDIAAEAADAQMAKWDAGAEDTDEDTMERQAGW